MFIIYRVIESNGGRYITEDSVNDQIEIRYEDNKVIGVEADGRIFRTQRVLSDPSHLPDKVVKVAQVNI